MKGQYTPLEYQRIRNVAQRRAHALRDRAVGDFWSYAGCQALRLVSAIRHPERQSTVNHTKGEQPCQY